MKTWLLRIGKILVLTELIYLVLVNSALNLPLTQSLVNQIKPEKFTVLWSQAWSPYPFRVHTGAISAKGHTRSLTWDMNASSARASISLVSLLWRTVRLDDITAQNVNYYQHSRTQSAEHTSSPPMNSAPPLERTPEEPPQAVKTGKKAKKAWHIRIGDIRVDGRHELQFNEVAADFSGTLQTGLDFRTKGGPFSLDDGKVDIDLQSLVLNGTRDVINGGRLKGDVTLLPFIPRENKGLNILKFLNADAEIETETTSLAFLNVYLANFKGMKVGGSGTLHGRIHLQQGELLDDTDVKVDARELSLDLFDFHVRGDGSISIETAGQGESTDISITFSRLSAFGDDRETTLFSGKGLTVEAQGNRYILPDSEKPFEAKRLAVIIPAVEVPDLSTYQQFFPSRLPVTLHGGTGSLKGELELKGKSLNSRIQLTSDAADVGIDEYRFTTNLDTALHIDSLDFPLGVDVSGTYFHLHGTRVSDAEGESSGSWHTRIDIDEGKLTLMLPDSGAVGDGILENYKSLKDRNLATLLGTDDDIKISGSVSDLSWLNVLLQNRVGLAVSGAGEVSANIALEQGMIARGTKLTIQPRELGVEVLDYAAEGEGEVTLLVERGGENPDASLNVVLKDGVMMRKNEEQAYIEDVDMQLSAAARHISFDGKGRDLNLHLLIHSAKVRDMAIYNHYLPENTPLEFTGGTAEVFADVELTPDTAKGRVRLQTSGLTARIDRQYIEGEITTDIVLADGLPENMEFDISGSTVTLDKVKVVGDEEQHTEKDWSAIFELKKAHAVWRKPVEARVEADLKMTNSRPIVAVLANQRGKHGWLEKALTIDDVRGDAVMHMTENRITVPYAYAGSDKIDVGAKGVITADDRDGVFYVRFRKLDALMKIRDGKRNLDVLHAKEKFDEYDSADVLSEIGQGSSSKRSSGGGSKQ